MSRGGNRNYLRPLIVNDKRSYSANRVQGNTEKIRRIQEIGVSL
jgi:hypothetical protein